MPLEIRTATTQDAFAMAPLLAELGDPQQVDELAARVTQLANTRTEAVVVAELDGRVVGVACLHVTTFLHLPGAGRGRLTSRRSAAYRAGSRDPTRG